MWFLGLRVYSPSICLWFVDIQSGPRPGFFTTGISLEPTEHCDQAQLTALHNLLCRVCFCKRSYTNPFRPPMQGGAQVWLFSIMIWSENVKNRWKIIKWHMHECGSTSRAMCYVKSWEVSQLKPPRDHHRVSSHPMSQAALLGEITSSPWSTAPTLRIWVAVI